MRQDAFDDAERPRGAPFERDVTPRLVHLGATADWQVAEGDPDIRGWDVRTADGEKIGTVSDLVVDTGLMKVRYIEARLDRDVLNARDDRTVLIPIGSARLDDEDDDVYLNSAIIDPRSLPPYDRQSLTREYEWSLRERFPTMDPWGRADALGTAGTERAMSRDPAAPLADRYRKDEDFYAGDLYDESRFFGQRRRGREGANYIGPIDDSAPRNEER